MQWTIAIRNRLRLRFHLHIHNSSQSKLDVDRVKKRSDDARTWIFGFPLVSFVGVTRDFDDTPVGREKKRTLTL